MVRHLYSAITIRIPSSTASRGPKVFRTLICKLSTPYLLKPRKPRNKKIVFISTVHQSQRLLRYILVT